MNFFQNLFLFIGVCLPCGLLANPCSCLDNPPQELTFNDIIERTFNNNLTIIEQYQNIENAMGLWKQEAGRFDSNISASLSREYVRKPGYFQSVKKGKPPNFVVKELNKIATTQMSVALERRLRSGLLVRPAIVAERVDNNFLFPLPERQTTGQLKLTFELPLLKNFGYENIGAGEIAASISYRASILLFKNEAARVIATLAKAYWDYIYSIKRLHTYERALARTKDFLVGLEKLIAGGEVAATEAHQVRTDLETRIANVQKAQQDVFNAKQTLMVFMNIDAEYYNCYAFEELEFSFPSPSEVESITCEIVDLWIQYALTQRSDYIAHHLLEEAAVVLVNQAINALEPSLDVALDISTQGLSTRDQLSPYIESFNKNARGVSLKGTISLSTPLCHINEQGVLQSRRADLRRFQMQTLEILNNIKADITTRASAIKHSREEVNALSIAVQEADQAVIDEIRKFQLGSSTVFDIIQLKDKALNTELFLLDAQINYIDVLIELRFFSGAILHPDEVTCHIDGDDLIALPKIIIDNFNKQHPLK